MRCIIFICLLLGAQLSLSAQFAGGPADGFDHLRASASLTGQSLASLYNGGPADGSDHLRASASLTGQSPAGLYNGGPADGFDNLRVSASLTGQSLVGLYDGGPADGFDHLRVNTGLTGQSLAGLYNGGPADGFDHLRVSAGLIGQSLAGLYDGGPADGFDHVRASASLTGQSLAGLYDGGPADGFDHLRANASLTGQSLAGLYSGGPADGFDHSRFAGAIALPLTLVSFDAFPKKGFVLIKWVTENEVDTDFFTIEKTLDGRDFEFVGETVATGSTEQRTYELKDGMPFPGTSFYRLKTTDFDGAISLSHLVEVQFSAETAWDFTLFPNPNTGRHFSLRPNGFERDDALRLEIIDAQGRLLRTENIPNVGNATHQFDLERRLPAGSYLIRATAGDGRVRAKVLVVGG